MNILHLSDTPLSGAPLRLSNLLFDHGGVHSRHVVWSHKSVQWGKDFPFDILASEMKDQPERLRWLIFEWADVLHFHNRWRRQEIFKLIGEEPPKKPSVIQIHSPRLSENFSDEVGSGIPLAIVAQYHPRQWPELRYIVPNVVDINDRVHKRDMPELYNLPPTVSYAPSNTHGKGWDDKGFFKTAKILDKMQNSGRIVRDFIIHSSFADTMTRKRMADIGIDEVITGSYHLSTLEYLSLGIPCFANTDEKTEKVVKDLTGCRTLPFLKADLNTLENAITKIARKRSWQDLGMEARTWMETYWNPQVLCSHYLKMYNSL